MIARPSQKRNLSESHWGLIVKSRFGPLLVPFLAATLLARVLTDDWASPESRHSGSLNLSGEIAATFILVAVVLLVRRRRGALPASLAIAWLAAWTAVAMDTHGASAVTVREGVREISVVALAVIVYNARGVVDARIAARLVQLAGFTPMCLAIGQFATGTGVNIHGNLRSNGTFAHPDSAAMFFAIAATASLWLYLDGERRRPDALLTALFAAALISTFSIDGLVTLVAMLTALGVLRPGSLRAKLTPGIIAGLVVLAFFATPLGSRRFVRESSTNFGAAERGEGNTSLGWRLNKWKTLLPEWESSPFFGRGLGTTTTTMAKPGDPYAGKPPHNEYIRYLVETGVIGVTILLGALSLLVRSLTQRRRIIGPLGNGTRGATTIALVIITGCLVNSLADNTFLNSPTCYAATLIVMAAVSIEMPRARSIRAVSR
jgi:O-antigen ligase